MMLFKLKIPNGKTLLNVHFMYEVDYTVLSFLNVYSQSVGNILYIMVYLCFFCYIILSISELLCSHFFSLVKT